MTMTPDEHLAAAEHILKTTAHFSGEYLQAASTQAIAHVQLALAKVARTSDAVQANSWVWEGKDWVP